MEFRILGPLEVRGDDGRPLKLGGQKPRGILAVLLCRPNQVVSTTTLIDELWGGRPPETAANMVQIYVSRLRKQLSADALVTATPGYLLRVEPDKLDAARFEQLVVEGRQALKASAPDRAAETLREALGLWRGPALADFTFESFAQAEIARLTDLRVATLEDRIEADLGLERHRELVGELEALIEQYPLRSRLSGQLMLALYRSGREAEALEVYKRSRRQLVEELGLDPSKALQDLEQAILRQDPALDAPARPPVLKDSGAAREVRKTVTVVCLDMTTSDGALDPEVVTRIASGAQEAVDRAVARHHGIVHARSGGRVTAVFGTPTAHEDDALRAARTALDLRLALANGEVPATAQLELRAGIEAGTVLAAEAPDTPSGIVGVVIDAAAKLSQAALPGDILVGAEVKPLIEFAAQLEAVEPRRRREDRPAWKLLGLTSDSAFPRRLDAPLVGRKDEMARLVEAYEQTVESRTPLLFTLIGPAGIGKSRLAAELRTAVADRARVLVGRCLPYGDGITFWPLREAMDQLLAEKAHRPLAGLLASEEDAKRIADRLAGLTGAAELHGAGREEAFWAVRRLVERLGRERPLVLIFDDCHWAEPTFLKLVDAAVGSAQDTSLLVLALARPEFLDDHPAWAAGAESMLLEPLSARACDALVVSLVGSSSLENDVRGRITEVAEGNPLFIEQMVAMLSEADSVGELGVPPNIRALLAARLDRVPRAERELLEAASVIGKEFLLDALGELLPEERRPELSDRLSSLVEKRLVAESSSSTDAFRFRHLLIRDAVYEGLPKERRAQLHERFADWLERSTADRILELEEIVGFHLEQALGYQRELGVPLEEAGDLHLRAGARLASAGKHALERGDMPGAVNLLTRAGVLLPKQGQPRLELLTLLAAALREVGDLEQAVSVLDECIRLSTEAGERALEWRARLAQLRMRVGTQSALTADEEQLVAQEAVTVFTELGDEGGLAKAWLALAWPLWVRCRAAETEEAIRPAIEYAKRAGDNTTYAWSIHNYLGAGLLGPCPATDAARRCEEVLARPHEALRIRASAFRTLAVLRAMQGDFDDARRLVESDRALLDDLGLRMTAAHAAEGYGLVELLAGDFDAAERELRLGMGVLEKFGERSATSIIAALLARALYEEGWLDEALRASELSEETALPDDVSAQVHWRGPRAKVLARRGHKWVEELARQAVALAAGTDFLVMHADALLDLAEVLRLLGRGDETAPFVEKAVRLHRRKGNSVSVARAESLLHAVGR
jgi:predicted ATPase/DNA-binding SARP family transcriptional activator